MEVQSSQDVGLSKMKKISSKGTRAYKKLFPVIWYAMIAFFLVVPFLPNDCKEKTPDPAFFIGPIIMAVVGFVVMKLLIFDLIDEVYDEGDSLLFRNSGREVRVYLRDIKNISYQSFVNPPRVTVSVRNATALGSDLTFTPPMKFNPFRKDSSIMELIDRVDQARRS
ncbi:MAG: hypothetical protein PHY31_05115 [Smithellaceae bacterium]|nr:hypothetical protein [Smithellaceae bacterium]